MDNSAFLRKLAFAAVALLALTVILFAILLRVQNASAPKPALVPLPKIAPSKASDAKPLPSKPVQIIHGGSVVKLIALTQDGLHTWWKANGQPLPGVGMIGPSPATKIINPGGRLFRAVVTASPVSPDSSVNLDVPNSPSTALSFVSSGPSALSIGVTAVVPRAMTALDIRVGIDSGEWQTLATHKIGPGDEGSTAFGLWPVIGSYAAEISPLTIVDNHPAFVCEVAENRKFEDRLVAVDTRGQTVFGKVVASTITTTGPSSTVQQDVIFTTLPVAELKAVRVQFRVYHFAMFDHLPLQPATKLSGVLAYAKPVDNEAQLARAADNYLPPLPTPSKLAVSAADWKTMLAGVKRGG